MVGVEQFMLIHIVDFATLYDSQYLLASYLLVYRYSVDVILVFISGE